MDVVDKRSIIGRLSLYVLLILALVAIFLFAYHMTSSTVHVVAPDKSWFNGGGSARRLVLDRS